MATPSVCFCRQEVQLKGGGFDLPVPVAQALAVLDAGAVGRVAEAGLAELDLARGDGVCGCQMGGGEEEGEACGEEGGVGELHGGVVWLLILVLVSVLGCCVVGIGLSLLIAGF